ncbi:HNH endonuclease [Pseudanabaena mucicola]|uniref:HNH endonuclease n=1 Tax=Pseudanabaena mucicola FACHB-723 TaxID=2692860 RepID=A0ABR8A080_9CYAN|nr:HNH endonuclease [Pseudanabaena mucicola]MBD2189464.1 HNH endonuclease [Pseudanabaena mucicola FACHB-723]
MATYTVESVWENIATSKIKVGKDYVVPKSVTFNLTQDYKDVIIQSYQEAFLAVVKLNQQHSFLSNPTISLLLHLIAVGDSNYTPVFLEWFEEQFVNIKDEYRCLFGNAYLQEYQQLKEKDMTNTDLLCTNAVANEHLLLCVTTQQEPNTEIVNDEPQEIAKTVDTSLTHSYTLSGQSLSASETNDLLFEELASEGFFDDDDDDKSIDRINKYIVWRQGQNEFRQKLLEAYSCCAITGCISEDALEAAHIEPYSKTKNNDPKNGLLLRADIHTLFDRHLIGIDPDTMTVYVAPSLLKDYGQFDGKRLQLEDKKLSPNKYALSNEYKKYQDKLENYK